MRTVNVELGARSYAIHIGEGLLSNADLLLAALPQRKAAIVADANVAPLYLDALTATLSGAGVNALPVVLPAGEEHKDWQTLNRVFDALLAARAERGTALIALGGGVVGDITGFAAATYMRGVPYIQLPTTLLSQVDSSVGGKTAINHPLGKNMIGAFYQPRLVLADTGTLGTLPARELSAGLAEVIKYGLIRDIEFFDWLERNIDKLVARDPAALAYAIERSCRNKAEVVAVDEHETGERALLNFGHTFGHAIETGTGFGTWLHGEAVAMGMVLASELSHRIGLIGAGDVERVRAILVRARLPVAAPDLGVARYRELMGHDKKVRDGALRFVLLRKLGEAFVSADAAREALDAVLAAAGAHA
ncbi:MAG TPA: 3-dehydroquinate synthase [Burkholderiales bacterium]|nr:3-dehydroquinate synthase [Burkholderiales bacterium]